MRIPIKAYAATAPRASLEAFSYDPGELGPEEVEIKVTHCGICHSDLSMLDNEWGLSKYPFVPGHEAVGTIVGLGESAKGLKIGQRVGVGWSAYSCLHCHECLTGDHHLCPESQGTIVGRRLPKHSPCRRQTKHLSTFAPAKPGTASCSSTNRLQTTAATPN